MSVERVVDVSLDVSENAATAVVTTRTELPLADLFVEGELRLWEDSAGWSGYTCEQTDEGVAYYRVNTRHDSEQWIDHMRVGEKAVRDAIKRHIEDPRAGGIARFVRRCSPP